MLKKGFILFFCFYSLHLVAQETEQEQDTVPDYYVRLENDTVFTSAIPLDDVYLFGKLNFDSKESRLRYYVLRRKTLKVYPYAKLAAEKLVELNDSIGKIKKNRQQKRYTKKVQKYIESEFTPKLTKLTRTEGQILIKLIHRQTGNTAFELVKNLRSGWRAFWYNSTARAFKINIKREFHPEMTHEDYLIEDILQRAFASNRLTRQKSVLDYDYASLSNKWKKSKSEKD